MKTGTFRIDHVRPDIFILPGSLPPSETLLNDGLFVSADDLPSAPIDAPFCFCSGGAKGVDLDGVRYVVRPVIARGC